MVCEDDLSAVHLNQKLRSIINQSYSAAWDLIAGKNVIIVGIPLVFLALLFRNTGLYPVVFADEWYYSLLSRHTPLAEANIPSYLYLSVFKLTRYFGDGFLNCARIFNCIFFVAALPFIYLVARQVISKNTAALIVIISALGPINTYTAYFMPEAMYFFAFWFFSWFALTFRGMSALRYGSLTGLMLGLMTMIKVHAIFIIPGFVFFITYVNMRSRSAMWLRQTGKTVCFLIASAFMTRILFGYLFAGKNGLSLFGSFYGSFTASALNIGHFFHLASQAIKNLKAHVMALVMLFGVPLASMFLLHRKNPVESGATDEDTGVWVVQIYALSVLVSLVSVTAFFTAFIAGAGPYETIARLHMRYYNFAFPFLFMIAASQLSAGKEKTAPFGPILPALLIGSVAIYSMARLPAIFIPSFVDNPELRGFTHNQSLFYFLAILGVSAVLAWGFNRKLGAQIFVFAFMPLSVLISAYFVNGELRQRLVTDSYDRAGIFTRQYLGEESCKLAIVGSELGGLFRTLFYIDNPDAVIVEIPKGTQADCSKTPKGKDWVLLVGDHEAPPGTKYRIPMDGFSLVKISGTDLVDFKRQSWPGIITEARGISTPGPSGTWSNAKEISLEFAYWLPKEFVLRIKAHAFGLNVGQPFMISIGPDKKSFRLSSTPQDVALSFRTDGTERFVKIEVPKPVSPKELGLSVDARRLGIFLHELRIVPVHKSTKE